MRLGSGTILPSRLRMSCFAAWSSSMMLSQRGGSPESHFKLTFPVGLLVPLVTRANEFPVRTTKGKSTHTFFGVALVVLLLLLWFR